MCATRRMLLQSYTYTSPSQPLLGAGGGGGNKNPPAPSPPPPPGAPSKLPSPAFFLVLDPPILMLSVSPGLREKSRGAPLGRWGEGPESPAEEAREEAREVGV